jgi:predicted dehydrogenase/threonine dehydrogenase-like Zn-dependent dehydrogenase
MKQILQSLKTGETEIADVPRPAAGNGQVLVRTHATLISSGTERMLVEFGKAGWLEKARQQPDKVRMVLDKIGTDGLMPTIDAVRRKLDQPLAMGYCNAGVVVEVGKGVTGLSVGDRVASNGKHAEYVAVPSNLCAKVPDGVDDESAAFTVLGAIALQGIRLAAPTLGECVAVSGLGLIGLLTVQLLRAQGCRVLAIDMDEARLALAREFGAETVNLSGSGSALAASDVFSRGRGMDAVIITASTDSNEPVQQAARMCRKRGRIVLVGVVGLELSRADFFEKELTFQVSCSYGPGRYDPAYEEKGIDYPVGFVRWTEQRNFEAVLDMMSAGHLKTQSLVTHRFDIANAQLAYDLIGSAEKSLGVILNFRANSPAPEDSSRSISTAAAAISGRASLGFIGAGNYAGGVLIPAFAATGARLKIVTSANGVSGSQAANRIGIEVSSTDNESVFGDREVDAVVISTRHSSHANMVCKSLESGKHVFVEKPLALTGEELDRIEATLRAPAAAGKLLMVGFNRRFSPQIARMKTLLDAVTECKAFVVTVNAGAIPAQHWTQDKEIGGGRIVGEACHFIDLLRHLSGSPIVSSLRTSMDISTHDTTTIQLKFADGSIGTVHYFANGPKSFPKERVEVFCGGRALQLDNFRKMTGFGWPGFKSENLWRQNKGQSECAAAFVRAVEHGGQPPIPVEEILEVARVTISVAENG